MSDFFTPPPPKLDPVDEQPPWFGPPENELGVPVQTRLLLARTEKVALALVDTVAYSTGLEFGLEVRLRETDELSDPFGMRYRRPGELRDDVLRFGFELADGRRVANLGGFTPIDEERRDPVLMQRGGSGGNRSWSFRYWLWPLPPPGTLTVVIQWPSEGVQLTRFELAAEPLLEAAAESEQLWPGGGPSTGGGVVSTHRSG